MKTGAEIQRDIARLLSQPSVSTAQIRAILKQSPMVPIGDGNDYIDEARPLYHVLMHRQYGRVGVAPEEEVFSQEEFKRLMFTQPAAAVETKQSYEAYLRSKGFSGDLTGFWQDYQASKTLPSIPLGTKAKDIQKIYTETGMHGGREPTTVSTIAREAERKASPRQGTLQNQAAPLNGVKLGSGEVVNRQEWNNLFEGMPEEDAAKIQRVALASGLAELNRSIDDYNSGQRTKAANFEAANIRLGDGQYVSRAKWNNLFEGMPEEDAERYQRIALSKGGLNALQKAMDSDKVAFLATHVQVKIQGIDSWIPKAQWSGLTLSQQDEVRATGQYTVVSESKTPEAAVEEREVARPGVVPFAPRVAADVARIKKIGEAANQYVVRPTWDSIQESRRGAMAGLQQFWGGLGSLVSGQKVPWKEGEPLGETAAKSINAYFAKQQTKVPEQAALKSQYDVEQSLPVWAKPLVGMSVIRYGDGKYAQVVQGEVPMVGARPVGMAKLSPKVWKAVEEILAFDEARLAQAEGAKGAASTLAVQRLTDSHKKAMVQKAIETAVADAAAKAKIEAEAIAKANIAKRWASHAQQFGEVSPEYEKAYEKAITEAIAKQYSEWVQIRTIISLSPTVKEPMVAVDSKSGIATVTLPAALVAYMPSSSLSAQQRVEITTKPEIKQMVQRATQNLAQHLAEGQTMAVAKSMAETDIKKAIAEAQKQAPAQRIIKQAEEVVNTASKVLEDAASQEKKQPQKQPKPSEQPASNLPIKTATLAAVSTPLYFKLPPKAPTKTPGPKPPPKPPPKPKPRPVPEIPIKPPVKPPSRLFFPGKGIPTREADKRQLLAKVKGFVARRRGALGGQSVWRINYYPYRPKDTLVLLGAAPEGARLITGRGSVAASAILLRGVPPTKPIYSDTGAVDDIISAQGRRIIVGSVKDTGILNPRVKV